MSLPARASVRASRGLGRLFGFTAPSDADDTALQDCEPESDTAPAQTLSGWLGNAEPVDAALTDEERLVAARSHPHELSSGSGEEARVDESSAEQAEDASHVEDVEDLDCSACRTLRAQEASALSTTQVRSSLARIGGQLFGRSGQKCVLCCRIFCGKHCAEFSFSCTMSNQNGATHVCQVCMPQARALADEDFAAIRESRLARAEVQRFHLLRQGESVAPREKCDRCLECGDRASSFCAKCGVALCAKHFTKQPSIAGANAPGRIPTCGRCVEVAGASATARSLVRNASAEAFRSAAEARCLRLDLSIQANWGGSTPLELAEDCASCGLVFSKLAASFRHHCRCCGRSLCSSCLCGVANCLAQGPRCPHRAALPHYGLSSSERVCHLCLPTALARGAAHAAAAAIGATAMRYAGYHDRLISFLDNPASLPLYVQQYVDTAKQKALRAGDLAVGGAKLVTPFLSVPWAIGVNTANLVWKYGQYGLAGLLVSGEILEGVKTLLDLSSSMQKIQTRDLVVGAIYLSAEHRQKLRDDPERAKREATAHGCNVPDQLLDSLIALSVLAMHAPYETDPFEAQRFAMQQHWRLVAERLGESWKHRPSWCLFMQNNARTAVISIRGTDLEQSCGGDLFTDVHATPTRLEGEDGTVVVAHSGMLMAAQHLESELRPTFRALSNAGIRIVLIGHSLGGAVAALLVWLLRHGAKGERLPVTSEVIGVGYAMPSVVDHETAVGLKDVFTSLVNPVDIVPRLSAAALRRLGCDIVECARHSSADLDTDIGQYVDRLCTLWAPRLRDGAPVPTGTAADGLPVPSVLANSEEPLRQRNANDALKDTSLDVSHGEVKDDAADVPGLDFEILQGRDPFPGSDAFIMPASTPAEITICKRACIEKGCGAFVVWRGKAHFRKEPVEQCRQYMTEHCGSVTYLNLRKMPNELNTERRDSNVAVAPIVDDLFIPGNVVWIHRVNGHLEAAIVPCDLKELRRIVLDKRMVLDHRSLSYKRALMAVRARRDVESLAPSVPWQRFSETGERCPCCGSAYGWMSTARSGRQRAHAMTNCRACGLVVCTACASTRSSLPAQGILDPARVCDRCVWRGPPGGDHLEDMPALFKRLAERTNDSGKRPASSRAV